MQDCGGDRGLGVGGVKALGGGNALGGLGARPGSPRAILSRRPRNDMMGVM